MSENEMTFPISPYYYDNVLMVRELTMTIEADQMEQE